MLPRDLDQPPGVLLQPLEQARQLFLLGVALRALEPVEHQLRQELAVVDHKNLRLALVNLQTAGQHLQHVLEQIIRIQDLEEFLL